MIFSRELQISDLGNMGFILAETPLAGTQLVRSRWVSAEILSMSYWVPGENDGQQNVVEDGSWTSYETTWRQVSHSKRRCVRRHQMEGGKTNPSKSNRPFSASEKNTFMYRWCNKPQSYWKARTLGFFFVLFYEIIINMSGYNLIWILSVP